MFFASWLVMAGIRRVQAFHGHTIWFHTNRCGSPFGLMGHRKFSVSTCSEFLGTRIDTLRLFFHSFARTRMHSLLSVKPRKHAMPSDVFLIGFGSLGFSRQHA